MPSETREDIEKTLGEQRQQTIYRIWNICETEMYGFTLNGDLSRQYEAGEKALSEEHTGLRTMDRIGNRSMIAAAWFLAKGHTLEDLLSEDRDMVAEKNKAGAELLDILVRKPNEDDQIHENKVGDFLYTFARDLPKTCHISDDLSDDHNLAANFGKLIGLKAIRNIWDTATANPDIREEMEHLMEDQHETEEVTGIRNTVESLTDAADARADYLLNSAANTHGDMNAVYGQALNRAVLHHIAENSQDAFQPSEKINPGQKLSGFVRSLDSAAGTKGKERELTDAALEDYVRNPDGAAVPVIFSDREEKPLTPVIRAEIRTQIREEAQKSEVRMTFFEDPAFDANDFTSRVSSVTKKPTDEQLVYTARVFGGSVGRMFDVHQRDLLKKYNADMFDMILIDGKSVNELYGKRYQGLSPEERAVRLQAQIVAATLGGSKNVAVSHITELPGNQLKLEEPVPLRAALHPQRPLHEPQKTRGTRFLEALHIRKPEPLGDRLDRANSRLDENRKQSAAAFSAGKLAEMSAAVKKNNEYEKALQEYQQGKPESLKNVSLSPQLLMALNKLRGQHDIVFAKRTQLAADGKIDLDSFPSDKRDFPDMVMDSANMTDQEVKQISERVLKGYFGTKKEREQVLDQFIHTAVETYHPEELDLSCLRGEDTGERLPEFGGLTKSESDVVKLLIGMRRDQAIATKMAENPEYAAEKRKDPAFNKRYEEVAEVMVPVENYLFLRLQDHNLDNAFNPNVMGEADKSAYRKVDMDVAPAANLALTRERLRKLNQGQGNRDFELPFVPSGYLSYDELTEAAAGNENVNIGATISLGSAFHSVAIEKKLKEAGLEREDLYYIDGKSLHQIAREKNLRGTQQEAFLNAALISGKSHVAMATPELDQNGNMIIEVTEIRLDLHRFDAEDRKTAGKNDPGYKTIAERADEAYAALSKDDEKTQHAAIRDSLRKSLQKDKTKSGVKDGERTSFALEMEEDEKKKSAVQKKRPVPVKTQEKAPGRKNSMDDDANRPSSTSPKWKP